MGILKGLVDIGNKTKKVIVINQKAEDLVINATKNVGCLHHIHIIDRSGSMSNDIDQLIENVKQTIDFMDDNDFVTVLWFSSAGQFKTLIKAAKKDESIKKLLDTIKSTLGCTCFSDPLKEIDNIIEETKVICDNFNITLFTDGEPVTPWSEQEEIDKIFKAINVYKDKIIAFNTIGYGNYYNKDLLLDIAKVSDFGEMIHSSKINEYAGIFSHNYERVSDLIVVPTEIKANNKDIVYLNTTSSKLTNGYMRLKMMEKRKNQFVIINDDDSDFDFEYNGNLYNSKNIGEEINDKTKANIQYALAYQKYYNGDRKTCLDILLNDIKDKALIDNQMNAFTFDEVGEYLNKLKKCVFKPKYRFEEGICPDNYLPASDAFCVMDLLKLLVENDAQYIYTNNYNRISRASSDTFNLFEWDNKLHTTDLDELVFNEKELNISIRNRITGKVKLNPKSAKKVGLPLEVNACIFRNQTLIKDGNLNIPKISILINEDGLNNIKQKCDNIIENVEANDNLYIAELNLKLLPVINQTYYNDDVLDAQYILNSINENNRLSIQQKVVKHILSSLKNDENVIENNQYTLEQIEVLKEHGLSESLVYGGVNVVLAEKNEEDYYMTRNLLYKLKGEVSLPSVNAVLKLKKLPTDGIKLFLLDEYDKYNKVVDQISNVEDKVKYLKDSLNKISNQLLQNRMQINCSKIAIILTGNWIKNLTPNDKGEYEYNDNLENKTLIVQAEKVKKYL